MKIFNYLKCFYTSLPFIPHKSLEDKISELTLEGTCKPTQNLTNLSFSFVRDKFNEFKVKLTEETIMDLEVSIFSSQKNNILFKFYEALGMEVFLSETKSNKDFNNEIFDCLKRFIFAEYEKITKFEIDSITKENCSSQTIPFESLLYTFEELFYEKLHNLSLESNICIKNKDDDWIEVNLELINGEIKNSEHEDSHEETDCLFLVNYVTTENERPFKEFDALDFLIHFEEVFFNYENQLLKSLKDPEIIMYEGIELSDEALEKLAKISLCLFKTALFEVFEDFREYLKR